MSKYQTNAQDLFVALGPSLSVCCCEFSENDAEKFLSIDKHCVVQKEGLEKPFVDLRMAARTQLTGENVLEENIEGLEHCTKCDTEFRFYSYRRTGLGFGSHVGFIGCR